MTENLSSTEPDTKPVKTYAVVGTGGRCGGMFLEPLASTYSAYGRIVAFCDISKIRMQYWVDELSKFEPALSELPLYDPSEFARLLEEHRPDAVIVCSVDATHAEYIVQSLRAGCDVIVEKPMATTVGQLHEIAQASKESGRRVHVAFNYRWMPYCTKAWEILRAGEIGSVTQVNFEYLLDTKHGADYFRRWHARMENSGGLLVHKATHHFDLINWWLDAIPQTVSANGSLRFYGKANAIARGDEALTRYDRYLDPASEGDPFRLRLLNEGNNFRNVHYHDAEKDSGYIRDRNVFRDDIDIYDTMSLTAKYSNGAFLTYSLVAYAPYEGFRATFTGDRGRLELAVNKASHLIMGQSDKELAAEQNRDTPGRRGVELTLQKHFSEAETIPVAKLEGGHDGGDPQLRDQLFLPHPPADHADRLAGWQQGAISVLLGLAANRSIATSAAVSISDLMSFENNPTQLSQLQ